MEKVKFRTSEVLGYLEEKISDNVATVDELELYEDYQWNGKLSKNNYTYKSLLSEMRKLHEVKF